MGVHGEKETESRKEFGVQEGQGGLRCMRNKEEDKWESSGGSQGRMRSDKGGARGARERKHNSHSLW